MTVNFYLRNKNKPGHSAIYVFVRVHNRTIRTSIYEKINPKTWDTKHQRLKRSAAGAMELNEKLLSVENGIIAIHRKMTMSNKLVFADFKKAVINFVDRKPQAVNFYDALEEFIKTKAHISTEGTLNKYRALKRRLQEFEAAERFLIDFDQLTIRFSELFTAFLIGTTGNTNSTVAKHFKSLKAFLNWATEFEYNTNEAFRKFKAKEEEKEVVFLTRAEVRRIEELELGNTPALDRVRDVFLFQCYTGQRFGDIAQLKRSDIRGAHWHCRTQKTRDIIQIPLVQPALALLEKYKYSETVLPVISSQKTNEHIKDLAQLAKITEDFTIHQFKGVRRIAITKPKCKFITTHVARKTFVTIAHDAGMTIEQIMQITGHKDYKTLKRYLALVDGAVEKAMGDVWNK